jgi:hypothetical protein
MYRSVIWKEAKRLYKHKLNVHIVWLPI